MVREDGSSSALGGEASHLGGALPQDLREVEVLRDARNRGGVLSVRHVGSLPIVPLVGDGIGNDGGEINGGHVGSGSVGRKILSVSSAALGPVARVSMRGVEDEVRATYMS